jgi:hypothetical protein
MAGCIQEWVKLITPSLTTVVVGGFFIQRFFVRRANQAAFIDHIVKELGELRDNSLEYWACTLTAENRDDVKLLEAKIKGRVQSLMSDLNYFRHLHKPCYQRLRKWFCRTFRSNEAGQTDDGPSYIVAMLNVYDACTGGDFETDQHNADATKHLSICSSISKVKSELLRVKL